MEAVEYASFRLTFPRDKLPSLEALATGSFQLGDFSVSENLISSPSFSQRVSGSVTEDLVFRLRQLVNIRDLGRLVYLPREIQYNLFLFRNYIDVVNACQQFTQFRWICDTPEFWREKASGLGVSDAIWNAGVTLTPQLRYLRAVTYRTEEAYPGSENYIEVSEATRRAAKMGRRDIIAYFAKLDNYPGEAILGALRGRHRALARDLLKNTRIVFSTDFFEALGYSGDSELLRDLEEGKRVSLSPPYKLISSDYVSLARGAAEAGDLVLVNRAIRAVPDILRGGVAILPAIKSGNVDLVRTLIGSTVAGSTSSRISLVFPNSAFLAAGQSGNYDMIDFLADEIFRLSSSTRASAVIPAFRGAAEVGNISLLQRLVSEGSDDYAGALVPAARNGRIAVVAWLLAQSGFDSAEEKSSLATALDEAVNRGRTSVVEILLPRVPSSYGLEGEGDLNDLLLDAVASDNSELLDYVVSLGARDLNNALHEAVRSDMLISLRHLLTLGADDIQTAVLIAESKPNTPQNRKVLAILREAV